MQPVSELFSIASLLNSSPRWGKWNWTWPNSAVSGPLFFSIQVCGQEWMRNYCKYSNDFFTFRCQGIEIDFASWGPSWKSVRSSWGIHPIVLCWWTWTLCKAFASFTCFAFHRAQMSGALVFLQADWRHTHRIFSDGDAGSASWNLEEVTMQQRRRTHPQRVVTSTGSNERSTLGPLALYIHVAGQIYPVLQWSLVRDLFSFDPIDNRRLGT